MNIKVAHVENAFEVVINAGSLNGVNEGQRFQIYSIGEEIFDPDSGDSLGSLEVIKGTGRVIHVQDKIATLASDTLEPGSKIIRKRNTQYFRPLGEGWTEEKALPPSPVAFKNPKTGDLVRPI